MNELDFFQFFKRGITVIGTDFFEDAHKLNKKVGSDATRVASVETIKLIDAGKSGNLAIR